MERHVNGGTSTYALEFICKWLNENGRVKGMNIKCDIIPKDEISIYNELIDESLKKGAVLILRVYQGGEHYCLLTKTDKDFAYIFDPYYLDIDYYINDKDCEIIKDRPFEYNRKIKKSRLDENSNNDFTLVKGENREIIIIKKND